MLPIKLNDLLEADDDELEHLILFIKRVDFSDQKNPLIEILFQFGDGYKSYDADQLWQIKAINCRLCNVNEWAFQHFELLDDHPLIWQYSDSQCSLYFNGKSDNVGKLCFDLYEMHASMFGYLLSFETFVNRKANLFNLLTYGNGLLGKGPEKVLENYGKCLARHNVNYLVVGGEELTSRDDTKHLQILLLGNSYVVAEQFDFVEITS